MDQTRKGLIGSHHGRGRAPTTSRQWTDGSFSTRGTRNTFENTTSRDDGRQPPPIFQLIYLFLLVFNFANFLLFEQVFATIVFSTLLSPRGRYFFTTLNFMDNIQTKLCFITTVSGRTLQGLTARLVRKPNVPPPPHKGKILHKSTKWTDPIRVNPLCKSTKWTDLTRVKNIINPQSGRIL